MFILPVIGYLLNDEGLHDIRDYDDYVQKKKKKKKHTHTGNGKSYIWKIEYTV